VEHFVNIVFKGAIKIKLLLLLFPTYGNTNAAYSTLLFAQSLKENTDERFKKHVGALL